MFHPLIALIGGLVLSAPATTGWSFRDEGSIDIPYAAFSGIIENPNDKSQLDLTISTFNPLPTRKDDVYVIRDISGQLKNGAKNLRKEVLASGLNWPNEVEEVPHDVFNTDQYWWVANGFLVPNKEDGNIGIIDAKADTSASPAKFTALTSNAANEKWWYHRVYFVDVDGDGRKDMLTARADTSGGTRNVLAEMVYFAQPRLNPTSSIWDDQVLFNGPDALFRYEEIPFGLSTTRHAIFSTQYFAEKLVASWTDVSRSGQPDFRNMNHRTIEAIADNRYFDSELVDVNGDGQLDLLVSINSKSNGKLVVFEIPSDWATGTWTRHLIADGFKPPGHIVTEGMGSPGTTFTFKPDGKYRKKPWIMLTGDDDSNIYVFEPQNDQDPNNWGYTKTSIFTALGGDGTVGAPTVRDVDGDGLVEVFVPSYSDGKLNVLTYEP